MTTEDEEGRAKKDEDGGVLGAPLRLVAALRNAMDIARLGRLEQEERTPYEVVLREPTFRLRRYQRHGGAAAASATAANAAATSGAASGPAIVLVPPLMLTSEVYDIAPGGSAVAELLERGADPWVVDFGAPERQEGALERTLADHVLAVSRAVDHVRRVTGRDVHLAGYSQGGIFVYLAAAWRRSEGLATVITFGTPVNVHENVLPGIPDDLAVPVIEALGSVLSLGFARSAVPAWLSRNAFRLMSPTKEIQNQLEFLRSLHDREALARREGQRRFLADEGWVAWPGPAFRELIEQMIQGNRLFAGGFVIEGSTVTLADVTVPVLVFVGARDDIARPPVVRSVGDAAPRASLWECEVDAGHMGLVVGSKALAETWPTVVEWMRWNEGCAEKPGAVARLGEGASRASRAAKRSVVRDGSGSREGGEGIDGILADGERGLLDVVSDLGRGAVSMVLDAVGEGAEAVSTVGATLARQLPRLARLEGLRRNTRVGLAMALAEQAAHSADGTFFLYEGRAHTFAAADARVDAIVRGLLSIGVRAGENVGVLMGTRPTALALVAAVNRLGAVAVMLRPDGDLAAELAAGGVRHLVADPELAATAATVWPRTLHVLGGVNAAGRALPAGAVDMERIDPAGVEVPRWYQPSPGLAEDVAFVFFAGRGKTLRANRITNRRWALSAFGTASAASLSSADTVYAWTPITHPTGLLVSMSGALVGGSRLAMAQGFSASTFWDDVRRYGASVVFYTGMMLREVVDAPRDPAERKHPVRMFAGSGLPRVLWQRLVERFGPVDVLEFYASTESTAILANVTGRKVGSQGRPLPGSAEVRLAAWRLDRGEPVYEADGFVRAAADGEPGMMLARLDRERGAVEGKFLRNVFERGDAWSVTGSVFERDADGDFRFVDHVGDFLASAKGPIPSLPIENAVWELPEVSAAAAYGLRTGTPGPELPAVAVVLRAGATFDLEGLSRHVSERLEAASRPLVVRVVDELPVTAGYRVQKAVLRAQGVPKEDLAAGRVFGRMPGETGYVVFDAARLAKLRRTAVR
jgi:putative long chain acyl-CoA synthase